ISFATRTKCRVLTRCARNLESSPSRRSGKVENKASLVTIPRIESPKNSSNSLSGRAPLIAGCTRSPPSCANELWVSACCSSSGRRKRWPSTASSSAIARASIVMNQRFLLVRDALIIALREFPQAGLFRVGQRQDVRLIGRQLHGAIGRLQRLGEFFLMVQRDRQAQPDGRFRIDGIQVSCFSE